MGRDGEGLHPVEEVLTVDLHLARDELDNLDIPYKFRDFCQEDYADYTSCVRTHPRVFENSFVYSVPFSEAISSCKILRKKWLKCEDYR